MKLLVTEKERQIVLFADNIILDEDVYYAWDNAAPHKVTRANTTANLEIVELPNESELPNDQYIIGKYVYTLDGLFEVWEHWTDEEI